MNEQLLQEMPAFVRKLYENPTDKEKFGDMDNLPEQLFGRCGDWSLLKGNDFANYAISNKKFIDDGKRLRRFCSMYHGMGWFLLGLFDTKTKRCFVVMDGGSNGYDRQFNFEMLYNFDPDKLTEEHTMSAEELLGLKFKEANERRVILAKLCPNALEKAKEKVYGHLTNAQTKECQA